MLTKSYLKHLSFKIIGCAIEVNKQLGPGLLESVYHACKIHELKQQGMEVKSQISVPVIYKEHDLGGVLKIDLLVENEIIIELKSVETMIPLYKAQLLSYMKLANKPKGLLINFNCEIIKEQITSLVTEKYRLLPE
jgi:GxxExxY protein